MSVMRASGTQWIVLFNLFKFIIDWHWGHALQGRGGSGHGITNKLQY